VTAELSEIVAPPERGRVFDVPVRAGLGDVATTGRVRLDTIARWLQDAAYADLEDALNGEDGFWVVRRTRVRVSAFPRFAERCTARTWCSGTGSMWAERRTTISGPSAQLEAVALWVRVDEARGRPVPPSPKCAAIYSPSAAGRTVKARLRHPAPPADADRAPWRFRSAELDLARHVNNAAYWTILDEELAELPDPATFDAEIEFRAPAQAGDAVVVRDGRRRWILDGASEVLASALIGEAGQAATPENP
jgi:acyl-ACP thioesterase